MKFDLSKELDRKGFMNRVDFLMDDQCKVDILKTREKRTLKQNSYMYVVLSLYGIGFGYSLNECKTDMKRNYGLVYEKDGTKYLRTSKSLTTKEMHDFTEYIRDVAGKNGSYIPTADEYKENRFNIDREIDRNKNYLMA